MRVSHPPAGNGDELARREAARAIDEWQSNVGELVHRAEATHRHRRLDAGSTFEVLGTVRTSMLAAARADE